MAAALAEKALANRITVLKNLSFSFIRSFSVASPSESPASSSTSKKSKPRKKKNLFEVAQFLPNWGLGFHMAKTHWSGVSYQITKINLYKDGRHGKAWGMAHKEDPNQDIKGWGMNDRGVSYTFGADKVSEFLMKNDMDLICRAHQRAEDGYEFFAERQLVTIFSAPHYCGEFDNAGALMSVDESLMCLFQIIKPADKKLTFF